MPSSVHEKGITVQRAVQKRLQNTFENQQCDPKRAVTEQKRLLLSISNDGELREVSANKGQTTKESKNVARRKEIHI